MKQTSKALLSILIGCSLVVPFGSVNAATLVPRKLDGVLVPKGSEDKWPVAVMIDNHTSARPQAGLQSASLVYETLAEGGIPRFMAVFADTTMKEVGPVRSTRPYFVRIASEFNAVVAHAGGSPDGLQLLMKMRMQSFFSLKDPFAKFFYRAHIGGVHGLYTTGAKLLAAMKQAGTTKLKPRYVAWQFGNAITLAQRPNGKHGAQIDLGYGASYKIEYRYDKKQDTYLRFTGGRALTDRATKKQITVRNILILDVPKVKVLDKKGRLDINVVGKGSGLVLKEGTVTKITWTKKNDRARTIITDAKTKQEIVFTRGNTWIEIVPKGRTYKAY